MKKAKKFFYGALRFLVISCTTAVKLLLLVPILVFMLWFSYTIDCTGWFQGGQFERELAQALIDGNALSSSERMDERQIVKLYAQNLTEPKEVIALGSSRVLQLTGQLAGSSSFFNTGTSGAEQRDVMSAYYLFDRAGMLPETVVFCVDPWIFSSSPDAKDRVGRVDEEMYDEFLVKALGRTVASVEERQDKDIEQWAGLLSPTLFQQNLRYAARDTSGENRPLIIQPSEILQQKTEVKRPDGSIIYPVDVREATQEDVNFTAQTAINASFVNVEDFEEMDPALCELFDEFIRYMQAKGSRVILLLSPYHPIVYDTVLEKGDKYTGFFQVEPWLRRYAEENGLALYGSYDPEAVGCTEEDFFDGWHVRGQGIAKYFPGVDKAVPYTTPKDKSKLPRIAQTGDTKNGAQESKSGQSGA